MLFAQVVLGGMTPRTIPFSPLEEASGGSGIPALAEAAPAPDSATSGQASSRPETPPAATTAAGDSDTVGATPATLSRRELRREARAARERARRNAAFNALSQQERDSL